MPHSTEAILVMLLAVVVSSYIVRISPVSAPLPLVQIGLGVLVAAFSSSTVKLDPHLFLFLFLPPLLFLDGWRITKAGLFHDRAFILGLAFGLVFAGVVVAGYFIHWLTSMPLPVAFALAAVLSPTDPVAVSSIVSRCPMPKRMMHILEGESLLNDASGLVCFSFAVAAMMTGVFSIEKAVVAFIWLAIGGVVVGVAATLGITYAQRWLRHRWGEETGPSILINLLIPFGAYLLAEALEASGILAAVAAGVTMSYVEMSGMALATTRVQRDAVWDMARFALNGLMFVLLGEQLPSIVTKAASAEQATGAGSSLWLVVYALTITCLMVGLRFAWVWVSWGLLVFRAKRAGMEMALPDKRLAAAISLAGVRGAITLAGVMSLPFFLDEAFQIPFPSRDQAIFIAAAGILISLVLAAVALPLFLKHLGDVGHENDAEDLAEARARQTLASHAIKAIEQKSHALILQYPDDIGLYTESAARVMTSYRYRADSEDEDLIDSAELHAAQRADAQFHLVALKAEQDANTAMARSGQISDEVFRRLKKQIDLATNRYE